MTRAPYRGRFAPSPTGRLHFGSLVAALASFADALAHQGQWLVRIDDVDQARMRPGAEVAILNALEIFGFQWHGPVLRQSDREHRYAAALQDLAALGLTYPCTCTRRDIARVADAGREGLVYPGTCRNSAAQPQGHTAVRIRTDRRPISVRDRVAGLLEQNLEQEVGDFIVRRSDGFTAYQLAVVVDDADQGITHVVRGGDLLWSTPRQRYLQGLLGLDSPAYAHVPLVLGADGRKLSKRDQAFPVDEQNPLPTLCAAWQFLQQPLPAQPDSVPTFWDMAAAHWDISRLQT